MGIPPKTKRIYINKMKTLPKDIKIQNEKEKSDSDNKLELQDYILNELFTGGSKE